MWLQAAVLTVFLIGWSEAGREYDNNGTHWIVAPQKIIPGKPLAISFAFYNTTADVTVQVDLLQYDHRRIATVTHTFQKATPGLLQIPVPKVLSHIGNHYILVHGLSGVYFNQKALLTYDKGTIPKRFSVQIQTNKAIYKPGQTVHFRTFGVYSDMSVYDGRFDAMIKDPRGNIMKYLKNVTSQALGVLEDSMVIDEEPVLGKWTLECSTQSHQIDGNYYSSEMATKTFTIDKYVLPKFTVAVHLPSYIVTTDAEMIGSVTATYTYGKPVVGNLTVRADVTHSGMPWKIHGDEVMVETTLDINGNAKFTIPFDRITNHVDPYSYEPLVRKMAGYYLVVTAIVTETLNNVTRNATAQVMFYSDPYELAFDRSSSPTFFKPGVPYVGHVSLTQADGRPVVFSAQDVVLKSYVRYYDSKYNRYEALSLPDKSFAAPRTGSFEFKVDPPAHAHSLHLRVDYKGLSDKMDLNKPSWIMDQGNLHISQWNSSLIGSVADFEVRSAVPMSRIFYMVVTNRHVTQSGVLESNGGTTQHIAFPVTEAMKPYSKLLVYYFTTDMWNADAIYFDVQSTSDIFKNKVAISFDRQKAEPAENVSLQISTDPFSLVNILAVDQSVLLLATGNDVTQNDVMASLRPSDHQTLSVMELHDPKSIVQTPGIQLLTDVDTFSWSQHYVATRHIPAECMPYMMATTTMYGHILPGVSGQSPTARPPLFPGAMQEVKHVREKFPETWLWTNVTSESDGSATVTATVPDTITSWYATAFSVNKQSGLGITDGPAKFTTFRPFFVSLNLPYSVVRGEHVVLQMNVFNYMDSDLDVVVTLDKSEDFDVIFNKSGHISFHSQTIVKNIHILQGHAESVFIPVMMHVVGSAEIFVKAQSALSADAVRRHLRVEAEGSPVHRNVPVLLSRSNPIDVLLDFPSNVVLDSQKIQVSAIGDIMGPSINNMDSLLRLPTGCGEQTMVKLAPDVFVYNYLQATNQLTAQLAERAKSFMLTGYQRELKFQRYDGSFSIWGNSDYQGSMWLTAFVLKSFHQAAKHVYVSDDVLVRAARWILRYQQHDGTFPSKGAVHSTSLRGGATSVYSNTAFVLIALAEAETTLQDHYIGSSGIVRARAYLEHAVGNMTEPYDLAITAYALAKVGSSMAFRAFDKLNAKATVTKDGMRYWRVGQPPSTWQRPWEAAYSRETPLSTEVTSYALLYLVATRQLATGLPILKWLVSQRNSLGGFTSTQDTVLGLQAMSEFGYAASSDLNLTVSVDGLGFHKDVHINKRDAVVLKLIDVPSSAIPIAPSRGPGAVSKADPPYISLSAQGNGTALVQVAVSFNVEAEPSVPAFNLTVKVVEETLHSIVIQACAIYDVAYYHGPGMCAMEVDIPTGFEADLESPVTDLPAVKKSEVRNEKTLVLYYDEISEYSRTCAEVELVRTDLVANLKPSAVRIYDYYNPGTYKALAFYQSVVLRDSSFCDVCKTCDGCI